MKCLKTYCLPCKEDEKFKNEQQICKNMEFTESSMGENDREAKSFRIKAMALAQLDSGEQPISRFL